MGAHYDHIPPHLVEWILKQHIFYVASAPLKPDGHVNVSPKGYEGSFRLVNQNKVWYEDLTGSGAETASHVRENGRITVMFVSYDGAPNIVRLFGVGKVHEFGSEGYTALLPDAQRQPGSRAIIEIDVYKVGTSCGYGIPCFKFDHDRTVLEQWAVKREEADILAEDSAASSDMPEKGIRSYWASRNNTSLDGLPAIKAAPSANSKIQHKEPAITGKPKAEGKTGAVAQSPPKGLSALQANSSWLLPAGFAAGVLAASVYQRISMR